MIVQTIKEYDEYIQEKIVQAKKDYVGYVRYEIAENGTLYLFSLGAYPSIIKGYCEPITIS